MSPASQGGLEVERYIGTCLISTHSRSGAGPAAKATAAAAVAGGGGPAGVSAPLGKPRSKGSGGNVYSFGPRYGRLSGPGSSTPHAQPPPWAGLPLISLAAAQHRRPGPPCSSPADDGLAQLAMRTQGAPLILAGRYHQHHSHTAGMPGGRPGPHHVSRQRPSGTRSAPAQRPAIATSATTPSSSASKEGKSLPGDNLSVASDESSGGHSSENSLPRIIKPRKRRKKDRKPPPTTATSPSAPVSPSQSPPPPNPQTPPLTPIPPSPSHSSEAAVPVSRNGEISTVSDSTPSKPAVGAARAPGSSTGPEVRSLNSDSEACSSCQCRYCDPAGRVWAAVPASGTPLRRSWSEPPPTTVSMDAVPRAASPPVSVVEDAENGALQVSTHIVTSLHGHRDLEIRFFSSSPPQRVTPVPAAVAPPPCGSPWGSSVVSVPPPSSPSRTPPSSPPLPSPQPQVQLPGRPPPTAVTATPSGQKNIVCADDAECDRLRAEE